MRRSNVVRDLAGNIIGVGSKVAYSTEGGLRVGEVIRCVSGWVKISPGPKQDSIERIPSQVARVG